VAFTGFLKARFTGLEGSSVDDVGWVVATTGGSVASLKT
jgi:hypothetical protein